MRNQTVIEMEESNDQMVQEFNHRARILLRSYAACVRREEALSEAAITKATFTRDGRVRKGLLTQARKHESKAKDYVSKIMYDIRFL